MLAFARTISAVTLAFISWPATVALLVACGEENQSRPVPIARRLGGDSMVPGALIKICKPEDEACVPTYAVMCSVTRRGHPAQNPQISPEEQAWCEQHVPTGSFDR